MAASTRASTGHSKPRIHLTVSTEPERKRRAGGTTTTRHNHHHNHTTKRTGATTKPPATHHKRKPHLSDKIEGAAKKLVGKITRRPGKKAAGTRQMRGTDGKGSHVQRV